MVRKAPSSEWPSEDLSPLEIQLDPQNPRIDALPRASQSKLRELLVEYGEIGDLAQSIIEDGILPGESIIVVEENGQDIVVEGNRRVCACQLLLDPSLRPAGHRKGFPSASDEVRAKIGKLKAVRAPSRESAEKIITKKHTEPGVLQWSPVAKQRRIVRLMQAGRSAKEVADQFGMQPGAVARLARDFNLLQYLRRMKCWTAQEREKLDDPKLKVNPFTRFFQLGGAKERLAITFEDDGSFTSTLDSALLDDALERVARELLFGGRGSLNTRARPDEVFVKVFAGHQQLEELLKNGSAARPTVAPKSAHATGGISGGTPNTGPGAGGSGPANVLALATLEDDDGDLVLLRELLQRDDEAIVQRPEQGRGHDRVPMVVMEEAVQLPLDCAISSPSGWPLCRHL